MKTTRKVLSVSVLAVIACGLCLSMNATFQTDSSPAAFADEGGATISDVMIVAHYGRTSLLTQLKTAVKGSGPENAKAWKAVRAKGAVIASLASTVLAKQSPPKGSASSWKAQVAAYTKQAKSLAAAAAEEDFAAASKAVKSLGKSCTSCHKAHKGR